MSWAFTTICHHLWSSALTPGRSGTDRGRQTASQRITGGLVSHWQEGSPRLASPAAGRPVPGGRPGELSLAEVEVLRLPWAMGAGGHRHLAADLLKGQLGHQQLPLPDSPAQKAIVAAAAATSSTRACCCQSVVPTRGRSSMVSMASVSSWWGPSTRSHSRPSRWSGWWPKGPLRTGCVCRGSPRRRWSGRTLRSYGPGARSSADTPPAALEGVLGQAELIVVGGGPGLPPVRQSHRHHLLLLPSMVLLGWRHRARLLGPRSAWPRLVPPSNNTGGIRRRGAG